ncbi:MAG: flippase-like domain-containing protein [Kiritimatiellae bacterium]|nr:flippase-like domain-containing protein [Kiritimatiellia bacterium]
MADKRPYSTGLNMSRVSVKSGVGIALSMLFLWLALRKVEWSSVITSWRGARVDLLLLGTGLLICSWLVAAIRWRMLLTSVPHLRIRETFAYISIGYLANTVLPLRLGDLARASLIGKKKNAGISRALGSIAIERMMDVLMLVAITLCLMRVLTIPRPFKQV